MICRPLGVVLYDLVSLINSSSPFSTKKGRYSLNCESESEDLYIIVVFLLGFKADRSISTIISVLLRALLRYFMVMTVCSKEKEKGGGRAFISTLMAHQGEIRTSKIRRKKIRQAKKHL
jgi:hypothetical protein